MHVPSWTQFVVLVLVHQSGSKDLGRDLKTPLAAPCPSTNITPMQGFDIHMYLRPNLG